MYKLIAFDMDGTLLDSTKKVREDSLDAIAEAERAGKYVALSTGRSISELEEYLPVLKNVRYVIGASGALLFENPGNKTLFSKPIDNSIVKQVFDISKDYDVMWHIHSDAGYTQKNQVSHLEDFGMEVYRPLFNTISVKVDNLPEMYSEKEFPVYKFNCYCRTPEVRENLKDALSRLQITMAFAETKSLEISALGISKASGLKWLCNYLSIPISQSIVVGDGDNDIEILKTAGLAVAMGNSNSSVKKVSDVVVSTNDDGGCAQAIMQYLLS